MRLTVLLLVVFGLPAQAVTLSFDWVGGPVTYDTLDWIEGYPDEPTGSHSASFVFEVPALDNSEFAYGVTYVEQDATITKNLQNAVLLNKPRLGHTQGYVNGYYKIGLSGSIVDVRLDMFDGGDHFVDFYSDGINIDHNQGDIIEWSKGYWLAMLDGVVIGSSEPGFALPTTDSTPSPVPLPASLPLLLAAGAVLFGVRRRRAASGGTNMT
jgi:hypothetical protein